MTFAGSQAEPFGALSRFSPLIVWALVLGTIMAVGASPILEGELIGTDGYMRLVRVEQLYDTGAWFDGGIARSNAPFGDTLHWTRPLDLILMAVAWPFAFVVPFEQALFWAGAFLSPVVLLASVYVMGWAARPAIGAECRPYVIVALLAQMAPLAYSMPGRIDHHALQILLLIATVGLLIRICGPRSRPGLSLLAGAVAAAGLWVSVEFLLATALAMTALWLAWLRGGAGRANAGLAFALGLVAGLALVLPVERPLDGLWVAEYDRLSVVHLWLAALHLGFWIAIRLAEAGGMRRLVPRATVSILAAAAGAGLMLATYPKFFGGAAVDVDPEVMRIYLGKVKELKPLWPSDVQSAWTLLFWIGPGLIALPFALASAWAGRHRPDGVVWAFLAVALALYLALSLRHIRMAAFAEVVAVVPLVALVQWTGASLERVVRKAWSDLGRSLVVVLALFVIPGVGFALGSPTLAGPGSGGSENAPAESGRSGCDIKGLAEFLNRPDGLGDRPRIIATHNDFGPELLYRTEHAVVGAPYHRNSRGILDTHRLFAATDPDRSRAIATARGIDLLLLCPQTGEARIYVAEGPGRSLYERLREGRAPGWLRRIALPDGLDDAFLLYRVVPQEGAS